MSGLRSVLLLCWRDTGHPQGGGSETYLQRIGAQLAASGVAVTLRTARYPGAPRREVVDGVRISRAGGRYSVYVWALLAMAAATARARTAAAGATGRGRRHPERLAVSGPADLRPAGGGAGAPLPSRAVAGGRAGARPARLVCRVEVVAAAAPAQSVRDGVAAVGPRPGRPGCRQRADRGGAQRSRRGAGAIVVRPARGRAARGGAVPAGAAQADRGRAGRGRRSCGRGYPDLHLDIVGDGWWRQRLVDHAHAARHHRRGDFPRPRR